MMQKPFFLVATVCLGLMSFAIDAASELQNYVRQRQSELYFAAGKISALSCDNGVRFIKGAPSLINDFGPVSFGSFSSGESIEGRICTLQSFALISIVDAI